jgi:adhesin HecA-like repeat protein
VVVVFAYEDLTDAERAVWDAVGSGTLVQLPLGAAPAAQDPAMGKAWGEGRQVRAQLLVELLTGRTGPKDARPRAVKLAGARVTGMLDLEAAALACPLTLRGCSFAEAVNLDEAHAPAVRLPGCHLPGLTAKQLETRGNLELDHGFTASSGVDLRGARIGGDVVIAGATIRGEVVLHGACVGGSVRFDGTTVTNPGGIALDMIGLTAEQSLFCMDGFTAHGEVVLVGAHVRGDLILTGANLVNPGGRTLVATRASVAGGMFCGSHLNNPAGFTTQGEVRLVDAHVGGFLSFAGARLDNPGGAAITAYRLTVDQDLFLAEGFRAVGEVRLRHARVSSLRCSDASFTAPDGLALDAEGLVAAHDVHCTEGFAAQGEVSFAGARVGGQLTFHGATLTNRNSGRWALNLQELEALVLDLRPQAPPQGHVDLSRAHVRVLVDPQAAWPHSLGLWDFAYDVLHEHPKIDAAARLGWLERDPRGYAPQPYEHLAAVYRRAGRDRDAARVTLAKQRRRHRERRLPGRLWGVLLDALVGYGYRTWLGGLWLLGFLLAGWAIFAHSYPTQMTPAKPPGDPLPRFQPLIYALDTLLPVVDLHQQDNWMPHGLAQWWAWASTLAGWLLTATLAAALTGLIKKD